MTASYQPPAPFQQVIDALLDQQRPFPPKFLHRFSDITPEDLGALKSVWHQVESERRVHLLDDLEALMETNMLMSYEDVAVFALDDPDPRVRVIAMHLLWETSNYRLADKLVQILTDDDDAIARATAANTLGQFVYKGEIEEIPAEPLNQVVDQLLLTMDSKDDEVVRRRALESLGFSSRPEVTELIRKAYNIDDPDWLASALFAMGRSSDEEWASEVLEMIDHPDQIVQVEAIRAAGNLELGDARDTLVEMIEDGIEDDELRQAAIWSLSQIGGEGTRELLEQLLTQSEDDDETELLEEALDNLVFNEGLDRLDMLGFEASDLGEMLADFDPDDDIEEKHD